MFIPPVGETAVVLLPVKAAPECVAYVSTHGAEEVWGSIDVVGVAGYAPDEGPNRGDVERAEKGIEELDGSSTLRKRGAVFPILGGNLNGVGVALPVRDEACHACDLRVGSAVAEV